MDKRAAKPTDSRAVPSSEIVKTRYVVGIDLGTTNSALAYILLILMVVIAFFFFNRLRQIYD